MKCFESIVQPLWLRDIGEARNRQPYCVGVRMPSRVGSVLQCGCVAAVGRCRWTKSEVA